MLLPSTFQYQTQSAQQTPFYQDHGLNAAWSKVTILPWLFQLHEEGIAEYLLIIIRKLRKRSDRSSLIWVTFLRSPLINQFFFFFREFKAFTPKGHIVSSWPKSRCCHKSPIYDNHRKENCSKTRQAVTWPSFIRSAHCQQREKVLIRERARHSSEDHSLHGMDLCSWPT